MGEKKSSGHKDEGSEGGVMGIYKREQTWYIDYYYQGSEALQGKEPALGLPHSGRGGGAAEIREVPMNTSLTDTLHSVRVHTKGVYVFNRVGEGPPEASGRLSRLPR